jgi:electron transfer flavoprotein alpha/beta subunit
LRHIRQAAAKPRDEQSLSDLGLEAEALAAGSARQALSYPGARGGAQILEGDASTIASQIASLIRSKVDA